MHTHICTRITHTHTYIYTQPPPEAYSPQDRASQRAAGIALRSQLGRVQLSEPLAGPAMYAWAQGILAQADGPQEGVRNV